MSERIYAWLLRLFPRNFQEAYGSDALQLFRDRYRDERSGFLRLRLWWDLFADLIICVPREHYRARMPLTDDGALQNAVASPGFHLLAANRMPPTFFLLGALLTSLIQGGLLTVTGSENVLSRQKSSFASGDLRNVTDPDSQPNDALSFTAISIKPFRSNDPRYERMRVSPNADLSAQAVSVASLLSFAYEVPANPSPRLSGVPDWALKRYDIEAKAPASADLSGLSNQEALRQARQMMRQLLAERFSLLIHVERKRIPVYALSVANRTPRLQESPASEERCIFDTDRAGCHTFEAGFGHPLRARAVNIDDLAHYIENWTDLPVVDRTGLEKLFTLNAGGWRPINLPPPPPGSTPNPDVFKTLPTISSILADLGLTLERQNSIVPLYTIERIEQPAIN